MTYRDGIVAVLAIVISWALMIFGGFAYDNSWRRDCSKLGAHVSDGVIYDCKPKAS